ncbi:proteinase inhibitor-like [Phoenix dactylifera]|uniref:Proteinase inhibitor-like n=1 Tax=Phoenix dactylifera TaxID=42345 RepID=A0A8B9AYV5_PHODC|nr:proteinase inhibitor-like [Phoenix dactylifera]
MGKNCRTPPDPYGQGCPGKKAWPELVGFRADLVAKRIQTENFYVTNIVILATSAALAGAGLAGEPPHIMQVECCNRVYLLVDENNNVVNVPSLG